MYTKKTQLLFEGSSKVIENATGLYVILQNKDIVVLKDNRQQVIVGYLKGCVAR